MGSWPRQRLGAQERRREKLVLGWELDPLTRQMEDDAAVDDESRQVAHATAHSRSRLGMALVRLRHRRVRESAGMSPDGLGVVYSTSFKNARTRCLSSAAALSS